MDERRKSPRIDEENEVTIIVDSSEGDLAQTKIRDVYIDNYIKDISKDGVGIKTNICLPVDALIELEFASNGLREQMKTLGKVKWVRVIIQDEQYDVGVEFSGAPNDAVKKLEDYISWKLKDRAKKIIPHAADSGNINAAKAKEEKPVETAKIKKAEIQKQPSNNNKKLTGIAIISLCAIVAIAVLLEIYGYIPGFNGLLFPVINNNSANNISLDSAPKGPATLPAPPVQAPPANPALATSPHPATAASSNSAVTAPNPAVAAPNAATPTPASTASSANAVSKTAQKIKVIGNKDSKLYHLPGMKYYDAVKAYHRVEFESEDDALKAGYHKAPK